VLTCLTYAPRPLLLRSQNPPRETSQLPTREEVLSKTRKRGPMEKDQETSAHAASQAPEKGQAENKNSNNSQEANKPGNSTSRQNAQGGGQSGDS